MTKRIQLTVLLSLVTFGVFAQSHFELSSVRTKEVMKSFESHPTVYRLSNSELNITAYDTVKVENPKYMELLTRRL